MFLISKCRGDWDLGLCTTSVFAFGESQRNDKIRFFLRWNTFFFRKSPLRLGYLPQPPTSHDKAPDKLSWHFQHDTIVTWWHQICPYPYISTALLLAHYLWCMIWYQCFDVRRAIGNTSCLPHACTTLHDTTSHPFHTARSCFTLPVACVFLHSLHHLKGHALTRLFFTSSCMAFAWAVLFWIFVCFFPCSLQFNSHLFLSPIGARTLKMPVPYPPPWLSFVFLHLVGWVSG